MSGPEFTVQDFDEVAFLTLKQRPQFSFVREEVGGAVVYTISDLDGELGHFAIRPGTVILSEVLLEMYSRAANISVGATWFGFRSIPNSSEVVDERDDSFRALCECIFIGFIMRHNLDMSGRPNELWEYLEQEEAASGSGGDNTDRPVDTIRVPEKQLALKRWKVAWRKIKGQWEQARSYTDMCNWLEKMHPDLAYSADTLKHIIRAGEAGMLE